MCSFRLQGLKFLEQRAVKMFRAFKAPRKATQHQERCEKRQRYQNTEKDKADVFKGKIERS